MSGSNDRINLQELACERTGYLNLGDGSPPWPCLEFDYNNNEFLDTMEADDILFPKHKKEQYIADFKRGQPLRELEPYTRSIFLLFGKLETNESSVCFQGERLAYFTNRQLPKQYTGKVSDTWKLAQKELLELLLQNSRATIYRNKAIIRGQAAPSLVMTAATTTNSVAATAPAASESRKEPSKILPQKTSGAGDHGTAKELSAATDDPIIATNDAENLLQPQMHVASSGTPKTAPDTSAPSEAELSAVAISNDTAAPAAWTSESVNLSTDVGTEVENEHAHLVAGKDSNVANGTVPTEIDSTSKQSVINDDDLSEMETSCFPVSSPGCANTIVTSSPPGEQPEKSTKIGKHRKSNNAKTPKAIKKYTLTMPKPASKRATRSCLTSTRKATPCSSNTPPSSPRSSDPDLSLAGAEKLSFDRTDEKIPDFTDVKGLLKQLGYTFPRGKFYLPGCSPKKNGGAGGCFNTESDFRRYLCQHGVVAEEGVLELERRNLLYKWVRFAIVSAEEFSGMFPDLSPLGKRTYAVLKDLGIREDRHFKSILPNVEVPLGGVNAFYRNEGKDGLYAYLARYGIPADCLFDKVSKLDRLKLEIFLAMWPPAERFTFVTPSNNASEDAQEGNSLIRSTRKRKACKETVASKRPIDKRIKATQKSSDTRLKPTTSAAKVSPDDKTEAEQTSLITISPSFGIVTSPLVAKASKPAILVNATQMEPRAKPLPDQKASNGEKLEACLEALKTSYQASAPFIDRTLMPQFARNLFMVEKFVKRTVESEGANGGKEGDCASMNVCGGPGIGKTSGVRYVCEKVIQAADVDHECRAPVLCYVNAVSIKASHKPLESVFREMAFSVGSQSAKSPSSLKALLSRKQTSKFIILVLDEIDALVPDSKADRHTKSELALRKLLECAADEDYPLALIGISNTIGNDKYDRLHNAGKFQQTIKFRRFTETELLCILQDRVGTKVIAEPALKLITKKVAQASGDVRAALDMVADAVKLRLESLSPLERTAVTVSTNPLVTVKDHIQSSKLVQDTLSERIRGIPLFGTIVLCVLVILARDEVQVAKIHDLRECVAACLVGFPEDQKLMDSESLKYILELLVDQNVLRMDRVSSSNARSRMSTAQYNQETVRLGTQLEDVCEVVKKELVDKQGLWAKIEHKARDHWNLKSDAQCDINGVF